VNIPTVTAIIVNYNAGDFLQASVGSILRSHQSVEVIVVDNASHDQSLESVLPDSSVTIVRNSKNLGFAAACNIGTRIARGRTLLFCNPDSSFEPATLDRLLEALESDVRIGMVGALVCNADGSEQAGGRRAIPTPWRSFVRAFGLARLSARWPKLFFDFHLHKQPLPDRPIEVEAISGACMLVKREAVNRVGEWDEGYFLHCEDLDWCMRFRQAGWKILFVPQAVVFHAKGVSSFGRPVFVEWHKHKGMVRFYRKFFHHQYPAGLMSLVWLGVWLRFVFVAIFQLARLWLHKLGFKHG
jgi:GT2 family glycosyltransferase